MAVEKRNRWKTKGRATLSGFANIPDYVLRSAQWGEMDAFALKLLMELVRQYNGKNNGDLSATVEMLKPRHKSWASKDTLPKKLKYLEDHGWIVRTRQGGRHVGCNLFAITWWTIDEAPGKHPCAAEFKPSHLWKNRTDTPPDGERKPVSRGARPFNPRQPGSKVVRLCARAS